MEKKATQDHPEIKKHFLSILEFAVSHPRYARLCFSLIQLNLTPAFLKPDAFGRKTKTEILGEIELLLNKNGFEIRDEDKLFDQIIYAPFSSAINQEDIAKEFFRLLNNKNYIFHENSFNLSILEAMIIEYGKFKKNSNLHVSIMLIQNNFAEMSTPNFDKNIYYNLVDLRNSQISLNKIMLDYPNFPFWEIKYFYIIDSTINRGNFLSGNFESFNIITSILKSSNFSCCYLERVECQKADLSGSSFYSTQFKDEAVFIECDLSNTNFRKAVFSRLNKSFFSLCEWDGCKTDFADIKKVGSKYQFKFHPLPSRTGINENLINFQITFLLVVFFNIQLDDYVKSHQGNFILTDFKTTFECLDILFNSDVNNTIVDTVSVLTVFKEELENRNYLSALKEFLSDLISVCPSDYTSSQEHLDVIRKRIQEKHDFLRQGIQKIHDQGRLSISRTYAEFNEELLKIRWGNLISPMGYMNLPMGNLMPLMGNMMPPMGNMNPMQNRFFHPPQFNPAQDAHQAMDNTNEHNNENQTDSENESEDESFEHKDKKPRTGDYTFHPPKP